MIKKNSAYFAEQLINIIRPYSEADFRKLMGIWTSKQSMDRDVMSDANSQICACVQEVLDEPKMSKKW